jgi:Kef-type K+ transport system membrane component KefB/Trk K+ transport system NAD-binding subunit
LTDVIAENVFYEIAALLTLAAVVGFLGVLLRQPLIVSFIAVGIIAGPSALHITQSPEQIHLLAELGIAILLFLVGIKLDVKLVRTLGTVALTTGLGQVAFTAGIGFFICLALGLDGVTSLYVAVALTFSSTIIIVKLLSDKREIDSLHGRIALGFLIVQDIVVVLAMIVLSAIGIAAPGAGPGSDDGGMGDVLRVLFGSALLLAFVLFFIRFVADPLTERMARAPELLVAFAIAMAALFAAIGDYVGFGKELGGLLAGIALASTPYREATAARLAPLRDFLVLFFFIYLGTQLDLAGLGENLLASVVLSLFVLIGNPLIVLAIMGVMGYRKRTGFLAGLTVAQISEFSLIFMAMGITLGHVDTGALGLVTLVGLITIAGSVYMITYSHVLYGWLEPLLAPFERQGTPAEQGVEDEVRGQFDAIVFGLGRFGSAVATRLERLGLEVLGVDFNPASVRRWQQEGRSAVYGDAMDPEFVASLPLAHAKWAIATMPAHDTGVFHEDPRIALVGALKELQFQGRIAVTNRHDADTETLKRAGAHLVLEPFQDAADRAVQLLASEQTPERLEVAELEGQKVIAG